MILSGNHLLLKTADGQKIELWDCTAKSLLLNIVKKGDYLIQECAFKDGWIAYSDAKDTQIFKFNATDFSLVKLTPKLCLANAIRNLPPAQKLSFIENEDGQIELLLVDRDLNIFVANPTTNSIRTLTNGTSLFGPTKLASHDKILRLLHTNSRRAILVLADPSKTLMIDLSTGKVDWKLPHMQGCGTPLAVASDADKVVIAYDTNKIVLFDSINLRLHDWTKRYLDRLPDNFLDRYNRMIGAICLSDSKILLYTNYTYCVLDLNLPMPAEVEIVQNHPGKSIEGKQFNAQGWFDNLKLSQSKYLAAPTAIASVDTAVMQ